MRGAGKRYLQESVRMDLEGTITHESRDRKEHDTNVLGLQPTFCKDRKSGEEVFMPWRNPVVLLVVITCFLVPVVAR